jgi:hypothetical protein
MEAVVTWRPTPGLRNEDLLTLSVPNGKDAELRVTGLCAEPKVSLLDKKVEFGTLAVGLRQERVSATPLEKLSRSLFTAHTLPV